MSNSFCYLFLFLILTNTVKAQITVQDSYSDIKKIIRTYDKEDTSVFPYINIYIQKAKNEKNYTQLYRAYRKARAYAPENLELQYADSCVWAAQQAPTDTALLGNAYLTKGVCFNGKRHYNEALTYYLKAEKFLHRTNDSNARHRLLFAIGQIKNYLELYDEAIPMVDSANKYFKKLEYKRDSSMYLYSLNALKDMHIDLGKYEQASQMYYEGKMLNTSYKDRNIEALLDLYEGYNQYKQTHYHEAIALVQSTVPHFKKKEDFSRTSMADFYLGLCYFDMGEKEKGISYFMKMDSVFVKEQYTRPRFRKAYEKMITYYKAQKLPKKELWTINQLLAVDERLNSYFRGLTQKLNSEYDTVLLQREKKALERKFNAEKTTFLLGFIGVILGAVALTFWGLKNYKKKKKLKNQPIQEYEKQTPSNVVKQREEPVDDTVDSKPKNRTVNIPDHVIEKIMTDLQIFEDEKQFLEKGISQSKLAKKLKTNTTYLSNIINENKGSNFSQYLNNLRVNYLIDLLNKEPRYRNYTISGLSEIVGYGNTKSFKAAFEEVLGKSISTYLEEI